MKSAAARTVLPLLAVVLSIAAAPRQADPRIEIVNLRRFAHANFTRIVLDIGKVREYTHGTLSDPGRIYIDVLQAKLNPILQGQSYPVKADYISQVRIAQKTASTVRLVVDIYPRGAADAPAQPAGGKTLPAGDKTQPPVKRDVDTKDPNLSATSLARQLGLGVHTVVIDPGHGGPRPGTIGKSGLQEKEINLAVALALQKLLKEKAGLDAVLTRESDVDVGLEGRTVIANQKRADLFVSIHTNAHRDRKRGGVETFFLNVNVDPSVVALAAEENATSTKNIGEMKSILEKIVKNSKIQESLALAQAIQKSLVKALAQDLPSIPDLGVKGGPFWVLIGGEMPSVLVEVSHLSNA